MAKAETMFTPRRAHGMKKNDVCFFERIVIPSTKFMISSIARCKCPSPCGNRKDVP